MRSEAIADTHVVDACRPAIFSVLIDSFVSKSVVFWCFGLSLYLFYNYLVCREILRTRKIKNNILRCVL